MNIPIEVLTSVHGVNGRVNQLERLEAMLRLLVTGMSDAFGPDEADIVMGIYDSVRHIHTDLREAVAEMAEACGILLQQDGEEIESA